MKLQATLDATFEGLESFYLSISDHPIYLTLWKEVDCHFATYYARINGVRIRPWITIEDDRHARGWFRSLVQLFTTRQVGCLRLAQGSFSR